MRVASLDRGKLANAVLTQSLTGNESLAFTTSRIFIDAAELIHGRVARCVWSDSSLDTEWRISDLVDQSGIGDQGQLAVSCSAILLDLARAPFVAWTAVGEPYFDITGLQLTASEWITTYVLPAIAEAGLFPVTVGTIEFANTFNLPTADWQTALEVLRAICQPGCAPGDLVLRRNGSTDYQIDILVSRGSTADTVRVQTKRNLLANLRKKVLISVGTKIMPRAASAATVRHMGRAYWRVKTVVSGTVLELEDPRGGAGPIQYDGQLDGLYLAHMVSTFASQVASVSTAATQRITVAATAGFTAGDFVEFRRTATSSGERVVGLSHPTRSLTPANAGYGARTLIADIASLPDAAANLCPNPWTRDWANPANPPDGWTLASGTGAQEITLAPLGPTAYKVTGGALTSPDAYSPPFYPYTTAGLVYSAHVYVYAVTNTGNLYFRIMKPDLSVVYGSIFIDTNPAGVAGRWFTLALTGVDLTTATAGVVLHARIDTATQTLIIGGFSLNEGAADIPDIEYSGGIVLWQEANRRLAALSSPIAGYALQLADLARLSASAWDDEPLVLGGNLEIIDADLGDTTTQRIIDYAQDLLHPLASTVQLANRDPLLTQSLAAA